MALGTVPVATGLVFDHLVRTVIALLHEFAELGGTACADVAENLALLVSQHAAPTVEEFLSVLSEDIGDFQPMLTHCCR
jgi:hypothetical protein